jgi:predicted ABC-type ATPase
MPELFLIAGANGSGKTTLARELLPDYELDFVNADEIAQELNPGGVDKVRIAAGKEFFNKIDGLVSQRKSFAIETTLSGQYLARFIKDLKEKGYLITLIYIFLDNPEISIARIKVRVRNGGHFVPDQDVQRRFWRGKKNFWNIYKDLADYWEIYYNGEHGFIQVATGELNKKTVIDEKLFELFI